MRPLPLGLRIVFLVVPLALVPLAVVGGVAYYYLETGIREETSAARSRQAASGARVVAAAVTGMRRAAAGAANLPQIAAAAAADARATVTEVAPARRALDDCVRLSPMLTHLALVDRSGRTIAEAGTQPRSAGVGRAASRLVTEDLFGGPVTILNAEPAPGALVAVHPVGDHAAVVAEVSLDRVLAEWLAASDAADSVVALVDDQGAVLAQNATTHPIHGPVDVSTLAIEAGRFLVLTETPPAQRAVFLMSVGQDGALSGRLVELRQAALLIAGAAVAFGLIGAGLIARTVVHPLSALLDMSQRIGAGQFNVSLERKRNDEIGQLVGAFNTMAASLSHYRDTLVRAETFAALGRLGSTLAHQVRNPLNAMRGCIELLRLKRPDDALVQHHAAIIAEEIVEIDGFVRDFLRIAHLEQPRRAPVDLVNLVESRVTLHESDAGRQHVSMEMEATSSIPSVSADAQQLGMVIDNLVNNAIEAMPEGGRLAIGIATGAASVTMAFADTGPGISAEHLKQLFTPFFTTKSQGTGIGLAIARRVVEAHGGTIVAENRAAGGAVFTVSLPVEPQVDEFTTHIQQ